MKTCLITGARGQDTRLLAKFLLEKGYKVVLTHRHSTIPVEQSLKEAGIDGQVELECCDITDSGNVNSVINKWKPDELYSLAAQSDVGVSFKCPQLTFRTNALGTLNLLEAVRTLSPHTKVYNASTSEMFGNNVNEKGFRDENTPFASRSPYATSKIAAHHHIINYREAYGLFACSGILFNHTSTLRGFNFVERKITDYVGRLYNFKTKDKLKLGNLDAKRDFTHATDMVRGMWLILQQDKPEDFVLASGETHSIREILDLAFEFGATAKLKNASFNWNGFVEQDPQFMRPSELHVLVGDASKAKEKLGWVPTYKFEDIILELVDHDIARYDR